ncbi:MAG: ribosomal protein S18-alanine N-acetyltransferase [Deltaproteobacteria bacterium]|nr:ribosomal protein S18-alanine N-acetyltransferase [Deltaproteobacteria bacterium]
MGNTHKIEERKKTKRTKVVSLSDLNRVFQIEKASFPSPWTKEALKTQINSPLGFNLGLEVDGELIGYIMCLLASDECHILNFAVDPRFRGRGYGSELLSIALDTLQKKGIRHVFLEVREKNLVALRLYIKSGFKIVGKRKRYYEDSGEDALVMYLTFSAEG